MNFLDMRSLETDRLILRRIKKQDAEGMALAIKTVAENLSTGRAAFEGIDEGMISGKARINIPYSAYTGE